MLRLSSLSVAYYGQDVIQEISLEIRSGEILALVGPNGAGKSTLIRAVSGVIPVKTGEIWTNGVDLLRLGVMDRARHLAVVPQARELPSAYSVFQTILMGRTPYLGWLGHPSQKDQSIVQLAMERTHTTELADRRVSDLSGGEQQRVLLARALAQDAPIMLLDEPTTHLDLQHQSNLLNLIRELCQEGELTVLMVLHDLNLAGLYANRVALLNKGRIIAVGTPGQVLTSKNLTAVYHVPVNVIPHPEYGTPLVLPDGQHSLES